MPKHDEDCTQEERIEEMDTRIDGLSERINRVEQGHATFSATSNVRIDQLESSSKEHSADIKGMSQNLYKILGAIAVLTFVSPFLAKLLIP